MWNTNISQKKYDIIELKYWLEKFIVFKFENINFCDVNTDVKVSITGGGLLEISNTPNRAMYYDLTEKSLKYFDANDVVSKIEYTEIESFIRKTKIEKFIC